ncbi:MAG TPA: hypothetical protein QGF58_27075 [Myxococcota bacterium]|nr:hypothetical protein [Myxococcota bacterium]
MGPLWFVVASRVGVGPTIDVPWSRFNPEPALIIVPLQLGLGYSSR